MNPSNDEATNHTIDVTVVIPAFNVAKYIGEALESAISQYPLFKQIIVVDDGSTDDTSDIVASYHDDRILLHYQENQGLGPARNAGLALAESEYIYFMDGDDVLVEGLTQFFARAIQHNGIRPDVVFFSAVDFDDQTRSVLDSSEYFVWKAPGVYTSGKDALSATLTANHTMPACAFLYVFRRVVAHKDPELRFMSILHEDEVFTPQLLLRCAKTIIFNQVWYRRRIRPGSIMTSRISAANVNGALCAARLWINLTKDSDSMHARIFLRQAHYFYARAINWAVQANVGYNCVSGIVLDRCPEFSNILGFDYVLARVSKKIARNIIRLRGQTLPVAWLTRQKV